LKSKPKLMSLAPEHTQSSIDNFHKLLADCTGMIEVTTDRSDISALMLSICESLGSAAFFSIRSVDDSLRVVPAVFGFDDAMAWDGLSGAK